MTLSTANAALRERGVCRQRAKPQVTCRHPGRFVVMECLLLGFVNSLSPVSKLLTWWLSTDRSRCHLLPLTDSPTDPHVSGDYRSLTIPSAAPQESHQPLEALHRYNSTGWGRCQGFFGKSSRLQGYVGGASRRCMASGVCAHPLREGGL